MKQKLYQVKEMTDDNWSQKRTAQFIREASNRLERKWNEWAYCYTYTTEKEWNDLYLEGRERKDLGCTYDEFLKGIGYLKNKYDYSSPWPFTRTRSKCIWHRSFGWGGGDPQDGFRQLGYEKKELSVEEINKREWKKKVNRYKNKNRTWKKRRTEGIYEKKAYRAYRKKIKQKIKNQDWDRIYSYKKREVYDPWW